MTGRPDSLLLDASCLLNLYATGCLREISAALPYHFQVTDYVVEQEALYIWRPGPTGSRDEREPVDLTSVLREGLIQLIRLEHPAEEATFIDLAADLDDGEAITGALAFQRGCAVATDDRKARRVLGQLNPPVKLVSTLKLLKLWAEESRVSRKEMATAMDDMQSCASYIPTVRDPLYDWWMSFFCRPGS